MDKLRIGIAGIGLYAATAHVPQFRDTGRAEVVAIARRKAERLELAQEALAIPQSYNSWQLMLMEADLDALVVCTPNNFHVEPTIAALEQGLHVLVEKPMALTSADAQKMASAAKKAEGILMVGYNARGMGSWRAVKEALLAGRIGTIQQINVTSGIDGRALFQDVTMAKGVQDWIDSSLLIKTFVGDTIGPNKWHSDRAGSGWGGTFIDVGTHILDLMLWLAEAPAVDVSAMHQQTDADWASLVNAQGKFANGITFSLTFSDQLRGGDFDFNGQGRVTIYGDRGYLTADWLGFMTTEAEEIWIESKGVRQKIEPSRPTITPAAAFVASILDGAPNISPADEALNVVALAEAILSGE